MEALGSSLEFKVTAKAFTLAVLATILLLLSLLGLAWPLSLIASILLYSYMVASNQLVSRRVKALEMVSITRRVEPQSIIEGSKATVTLMVTNNSPESLNLILIDRIPARARSLGPSRFLAKIPGGGSIELSYDITGAPGAHDMEEVRVELVDPLGLFKGVRIVKAYSRLKVTPLYQGLVEMASRELQGVSGLHSRIRVGDSLELHGLREYVVGDDPRRIAWLATARRGELIVRDTLRELRVDLCILLDLSRESWYGVPGDAPGDWIARFSLGLAIIASRSGGVTGFTLYDGEIHRYYEPPPGSNPASILASLISSYNPLESRASRELPRAIRDTMAYCRGRWLVILAGPSIMERFDVKSLISPLVGSTGRTLILVFTPQGDDRVSREIRYYSILLFKRFKGEVDASGLAVTHLVYDVSTLLQGLRGVVYGLQGYR